MTRLEAAFWARVERAGKNECWNWTGHRTEKGYGRLHTHEQDQVFAHRLAYELHHGPIPDGLTIDHLCENRACCNPAHLEPVTSGANNLRGNSPWALNAKKLTCHAGHPLEGDNLRIDVNRGRICKACARAATARWRERNRTRTAA